MPLTTDFPDIRRADAGTALVSTWLVPTAGLQRPAADAVHTEWEHQERPDAMLSLTTFLSTDGGHLLHYAQWTNDDDHREWARTRREAAVGRIDEAVPGIRRPGLVRYRRYRSYVPERPAGRRPALLVVPAFATTGPAAQHTLADAVLGVLAREQVPGLLGAHFHLSQDGTKVLNYAEWEDLSAWREFADRGVSAELAAAIRAMDGVRPVPPEFPAPPEPGVSPLRAVARYHLYRSLINVPVPAGTASPAAGRAATPPRGDRDDLPRPPLPG
ncbi:MULTISPECIES: antibiotic biosynthesis monooxygenase [Streptomyces]|uniref:antibiotic biosynthesis monooxygenase n=1 Tax=Streptomyces TaxID=1883 RepID=UPI000DA60B8B|nr:antibiotic biosynthesis monooxygenase [Streptomyces sp. SID7805]MYU54090.1 antibiotic biosynthesis monooxygenase [Streptomyces sp. SID7805]